MTSNADSPTTVDSLTTPDELKVSFDGDSPRQEMLTQILDALSPDVSSSIDVSSQQSTLDVQTIVQVVEDQCVERMEQREREVTKKLKLQQEKEMKALTQRCIKDKQALKLEAEADRKAMGLEVARVKKRLIEAEREKHQATCQTAQTQRDARNLRRQLEEAEDAMIELKTVVRNKEMEITELERSQKRYRREKEQEMQRLNEHVLNLEAKLNNQEAIWSDRWTQYLETTESEKARSFSGAEDKIREAYRKGAQFQLISLEERIGELVSKERGNIKQLMEFKEKLHLGYIKATKIQQLFRQGAEEDVTFMRTVITQMHHWMRALSQENKKHLQKTLEIEKALTKAGISSISSFQQEMAQIKYVGVVATLTLIDSERDELERSKSYLTKEQCEKDNLQCQLRESQASQNRREETIRQLSVQVQNLDHDLEVAAQHLHDAHQERDISKNKCTEFAQQNTHLSDELSRVATQLASKSHQHAQSLHDVHRLTSELQSLHESHAEELSNEIRNSNSEWLSIIQESKAKLLGNCHSSVDSLHDVLCDATTQSCLRSLKLNTRLRTAGVERKSINSAVRCIASRLNTNLDAVVQSVDLEAVLEYLKTNAVRDCEVGTALREIECLCFWFMLDAHIKKEISGFSRSTSSLEATEEQIPVKGKGLRTWRRARERLRKQHLKEQLCNVQKDISPRTEAEEIVEIIEVLKEHIKNGKQETE